MIDVIIDYMSYKASIQLYSQLAQFHMCRGFNQMIGVLPLQIFFGYEEVPLRISERPPLPININLIGAEACFIKQGCIFGNIITKVKIFDLIFERVFYLL